MCRYLTCDYPVDDPSYCNSTHYMFVDAAQRSPIVKGVYAVNLPVAVPTFIGLGGDPQHPRGSKSFGQEGLSFDFFEELHSTCLLDSESTQACNGGT